MTTDCLFCKIAAGKIPSKQVYADAEMLAFHDINPQAPVHVLVIPKKHFTSLNDFTEAEALLLGKMAVTAKKIAADLGIAESGYRVVMNTNADGGQTVAHVHLHLLGGRRLTWPPG